MTERNETECLDTLMQRFGDRLVECAPGLDTLREKLLNKTFTELEKSYLVMHLEDASKTFEKLTEFVKGLPAKT